MQVGLEEGFIFVLFGENINIQTSDWCGFQDSVCVSPVLYFRKSYPVVFDKTVYFNDSQQCRLVLNNISVPLAIFIYPISIHTRDWCV